MIFTKVTQLNLQGIRWIQKLRFSKVLNKFWTKFNVINSEKYRFWMFGSSMSNYVEVKYDTKYFKFLFYTIFFIRKHPWLWFFCQKYWMYANLFFLASEALIMNPRPCQMCFQNFNFNNFKIILFSDYNPLELASHDQQGFFSSASTITTVLSSILMTSLAISILA